MSVLRCVVQSTKWVKHLEIFIEKFIIFFSLVTTTLFLSFSPNATLYSFFVCFCSRSLTHTHSLVVRMSFMNLFCIYPQHRNVCVHTHIEISKIYLFLLCYFTFFVFIGEFICSQIEIVYAFRIIVAHAHAPITIFALRSYVRLSVSYWRQSEATAAVSTSAAWAKYESTNRSKLYNGNRRKF